MRIETSKKSTRAARLLRAPLALAAAGCFAASCTPSPDRSADAGAALKVEAAPDSARARSILDGHSQLFQQNVKVHEAATRPGVAPSHAVRTMSALPKAVADRFEVEGSFLRPHLSSAGLRGQKAHVDLTLPATADGAFQLRDLRSGMSVEVTTAGATPAPAEAAGGYLVYPAGHTSGADLLHRPTAAGTEDFFVFHQPPADGKVAYDVALGDTVAGLRLFGNTVEFLDAKGAPRLRVSPPYLLDADSKRHAATLGLEGCAADTSAAPPWDRKVTPPGADHCRVTVTWNSSKVAYPALLDPSWVMAADQMSVGRKYHTATLMANGRVLLVGGETGGGFVVNSCEIYDSVTHTTTTVASIPGPNGARRGHAASLISGNRVLITGGEDAVGTLIPTNLGAYTFNGTAWSAPITMRSVRSFHTQNTLSSGDVIVAGGKLTVGTDTATTERFTGAAFVDDGNLTEARRWHASAVTPDGTHVLVVGGNHCTGVDGSGDPVCTLIFNLNDPDNGYGLRSADLYTVGSGWASAGNSGTRRSDVAAVALDNTHFLVTPFGAFSTGPSSERLTIPLTWTATGGMQQSIQGNKMALLGDGSVLSAGNINFGAITNLYVETYRANTWTESADLVVNGGADNKGRTAHTLTALPNGEALVAGGDSNTGEALLTDLILFHPESPNGSPCDSSLGTSGNPDCGSGHCVNTGAGFVCCDLVCGAVANSTLSCTAANGGVCTVTSCGAGFNNCNSNAGDGCETNTATDATACGACGATCQTANANGPVTCSAGQCVFSCQAGFANCNDPTSQHLAGCNTSTATSATNCGACGNVCQTANANGAVTCATSQCQFTCQAGFANCNDPSSQHLLGCNTSTTVNGNCGGCGVSCVTSPTCKVNAFCNATLNGGNGACDSVNRALCDNPQCGLVGNADFATCSAFVEDNTTWKDTDGDGFSDIQERLGYIDTNCNGRLDVGVDFQFPTEASHVFSTVAHTGSTVGQVFPTVTDPTLPVAATTVEVTIEGGGGLGIATFHFRIGGGSPSASQLVKPEVDIAGNNRLLFTLIPITATFVAGDVFTYTTSMAADAPVASEATPNVYVQYDYMDFDAPGAACGNDAACMNNQPNAVCHAGFCNHDHRPGDPLFRLVKAAFANRGMRLYIDPIHNAVPHARVLTYARAGDSGPLANGPLPICAGGTVVSGVLSGAAVSFHDVKQRPTLGGPFLANRQSVYRYGVFAHNNTCLTDDPFALTGNCKQCPPSTPSGAPKSDSSGKSEVPGNDFIVSEASSFNNPGGSIARNPIIEGGVFMHELGHTLGLHHAGDLPDPEDAPNYLSVMNGRYVFSGIQAANNPGDVDPVEANRHLDYSTHKLRTLNEGNLVVSDGTSVLPSTFTGIITFRDGVAGVNGHGPEAGPISWCGSATCNIDINGSSDIDTKVMVGFQDGLHPTTGASCVTNANCTAPLSTCDLTNHLCTGPCTTNADCRINAIRQNIHDLVDANMDPHEVCQAGSCNSIVYPFQCLTWTQTGEAPPPPAFVTGKEPDPITAAATHTLYPVATASIDVRPGCSTNWIALSGPGTVPVAILGSTDVDVTLIDVVGLRAAGIAPSSTSISDLNGDGKLDMLAQFDMASLPLPLDATSLQVTGFFASSQAFQGSDTITLVPTAGPVVTIHNDGSGFSQTIAGNLNGTFMTYTLANCVDSVSDRCGNSYSINSAGNIVKITSDEPTSGGMVILSSSSFKVERKRIGTENGRVYTVHFNVTDSIGNVTATSCQIQVKHAQSDTNAIASPVVSCVGACP